MHNVLVILQILIVFLLTFAVLSQSQGGGLGSSFGSSGSYHTKRGMEKGLFVATIILSVLFAVNSLALLLL